VWKCPLVGDLEDLNFFNLEIFQTRENDHIVQFGVVGVSIVKVNVTAGICIAVIVNMNVIPKVRTPFEIIKDCPVLFFGRQGKSPRWDVVRILQRENNTLQTAIRHLAFGCARFPLHRSETAEDIPFRVQNHSQCVCVAVASPVKFLDSETIAGAPTQKSKPLTPELCENLLTVRNDPQIE
jgi:hypothetical protein